MFYGYPDSDDNMRCCNSQSAAPASRLRPEGPLDVSRTISQVDLHQIERLQRSEVQNICGFANAATGQILTYFLG